MYIRKWKEKEKKHFKMPAFVSPLYNNSSYLLSTENHGPDLPLIKKGWWKKFWVSMWDLIWFEDFIYYLNTPAPEVSQLCQGQGWSLSQGKGCLGWLEVAWSQLEPFGAILSPPLNSYDSCLWLFCPLLVNYFLFLRFLEVLVMWQPLLDGPPC